MYKNKKEIDNSISLSVGIPGFEPGMTGPESVVLPLHHIPLRANSLLNCECKGSVFYLNNKTSPNFFIEKVQFKIPFARIHKIVYLVYPLIFSLNNGGINESEKRTFLILLKPYFIFN